MTTVANATHPCVAALLQGSARVPRAPHAWLNARRGEALERANALSVPTTRDEDWRFTDISPLTRVPFHTAAGATRLAPSELATLRLPEATIYLTFIDGVFARELSATVGPPDGVVVTDLASALDADPATLEAHLARYARYEREVFTALNTAWLHDGAYIRIGKDRKCAVPVHLRFASTHKETVSYPRVLIVLEAGAEATVVEEYVALEGADSYFGNAVSEIVVSEHARLRHVKLQHDARAAFHIGHCAVALAKDARYESDTVTLGARISRNTVNVVQQGEGAECRIDGLTLISGRQLADTHTAIDHTKPSGRSRQLHKCIVADAAHAVFNGKIFVREGAQLTDSAQQSRNLLLSPKAHVDTKPQLEIFADDVKCAHGATVGQLDPEQLFYLRSRGLPEARARNLLTYAFGAEVIDRLPVPSLVERLERVVLEQTQAPE
ncbi:MAG TPA: Fe-S cluster assembly protein SufD [Burkholderiales bacterium]|nr:Fe-S cluster assembly protein SufD [Burkholderiales bacterium]